MERLTCDERAGWRAKVESRGLTWHTPGEPYWHEGVYYRFDGDEIEHIERATNELHALCLQAVQNVIDEKRWAQLRIPAAAIPLIEASWNEEPPSIYGRFDLAYGTGGPPKMLEYNADTPTALLEAAVIQWDWLQALYPHADQFNSLHERLVQVWRDVHPFLKETSEADGRVVHFTSMDNEEDGMTAAYVADTARQSGLRVRMLPIAEVGWNAGAREFRDADDDPVATLFKLYPWEWLINEPFAEHIAASGVALIEPAWKMVLSNKGILPILWELFPDSPYLLPAFFDSPGDMFEWVRKPLLSREGANVTVHTMQDHIEGHGGYGADGFVFQELAPIPEFDGRRPVLGSWIIGQEAGGMGIRESDGWVTDNTSRFVAHLFE